MDLPEGSIDDYIAAKCGDEGFDCDLLRAVADANRKWGAQTGLGHAETIERWLALTPIERAAELTELRKIVLTDKGTPRGRRPASQRPSRTTKPTPGASPTWSASCCDIQNGARLAARYGRRAARRPGLCRGLHPRQAQRRGRRLRRPHRLDPAAARPAGDGRLGALQARPADRSCPGRRGAGHQCRPVGDRRAAGRRIFQRLERGRGAAPHPVHGRRLQAGHLRLPGHRPAANSSEARRTFGSARRRCSDGDDLFSSSGARASFATCRSRPASARRSRCSMSSMR